MGSFRLIALTAPGRPDPAIAIAASRAGELGVLNLEHGGDAEAAGGAIDRMARYAQRECGIKLAGDAGPGLLAIAFDLPRPVTTVILAGPHLGRRDWLAERIRHLAQRGLT